MGIAEMAEIEMMPSITVARIPLFPETKKQNYTNKANSFGCSGVFVQRDSFFSGPRSQWFHLGVFFILITQGNTYNTTALSHNAGLELLEMEKAADHVVTSFTG